MIHHIAAVIPCFNVGSACIPIVQACSQTLDLCVVVDDGSVDNTGRHIASVHTSNCRLIRHEKNHGKGSALITGFRHILAKEPQIEAVVTLDGDGQHDPDLLSGFIDQYSKQRTDLVYGNRMAQPGAMPIHRWALNTISNGLVSRVISRPIHDSQCGYRLYSRRLLESIIGDVRTTRYELETEILILACRRNFQVDFVPITSIYSGESTSLSHHSFLDVLRIGKLLAQEFRNRIPAA
jgi:glycosyltransferase involved in cell wall biosynthesis